MSALQNYLIALRKNGECITEQPNDTVLVVETKDCFWVIYTEDEDEDYNVARWVKSYSDYSGDHYFTGKLADCTMYVSNK